MKMYFKVKDGIPLFTLKYENNEWAIIESKLKELGLEKAVTKNGFGNKQVLEFYKEKNWELQEYLGMYYNVIDDINAEIVSTEKGNIYVNLAILRVVPDANGEVNLVLNKYITVFELEKMISVIKEALEIILNYVINDVEVKIKTNGGDSK
jgi:hypothetical protein